MKKLIILFLCFALCLSLSACGGSKPAPSDTAQTPEPTPETPSPSPEVDWYYPITPDDEEYQKLSSTEIMELCNMPVELLEKASTEYLADLVLDYPLLSSFFSAYDNVDFALSNFCRFSNIFEEFFSRSDAYDVLLEKYSTLTVDYNVPSEEDLLRLQEAEKTPNVMDEQIISKEIGTKIRKSGQVKSRFITYLFHGKEDALTAELINRYHEIQDKKINAS